jgi:hypothetical protein
MRSKIYIHVISNKLGGELSVVVISRTLWSGKLAADSPLRISLRISWMRNAWMRWIVAEHPWLESGYKEADMNYNKVVLGLALVVIFSGITVYGQEETPEQVAKTSMEFTVKGDWASFARLMHPEALAAARGMFRPIFDADKSGQFGEAFFGVKTPAEFDALSDVAAFEALMTNLTKNIPLFTDVLKSAEFSIVGSVAEGTELVHVVYRTGAKAEGLTISKLSVVSLRRHQGRWRLLLTGNIDGLAAAFLQKAKSDK